MEYMQEQRFCCGASIRHGFKSIESSYLLADHNIGCSGSNCSLSISQGDILNTKTVSWVEILHLKRPVIQVKLQKPKGEVITFRDFPWILDFDELYHSFSFDQWCCLHAEVYGLSGTSIKESVVIRAQGQQDSGTYYNS